MWYPVMTLSGSSLNKEGGQSEVGVGTVSALVSVLAIQLSKWKIDIGAHQ